MLRTHLRATGTTTVLVTHDVLDTAVLADRMVVLAAGSVVDEGPALELFASPRSEFTAALAGLNLVPGTVESATEEGTVTVSAGGVQLTGIADAVTRRTAWRPVARRCGPIVDRSRRRSFRRGLSLGRRCASPLGSWLPAMRWPWCSRRRRWRCSAAPRGRESAQRLDGGGPGHRTGADGGATAHRDALAVSADVTPAAVAELGIAGGEQVWLAVKATEVRVYRR